MPERSTHRLPSRPVWTTVRNLRKKEPRTGRTRSFRTAVVRWREDGRVRERTFDDPVAAGRFAGEKEDELEGRRLPPPSEEITFTDCPTCCPRPSTRSRRGPGAS